jgi:predicted nuclease of predicted toxin-antitoxin system
MARFTGFLVDQMLPASLATQLRETFPSSVHVREVSLSGRSDRDVSQFADENGLAVITKDRDFERFMQTSASPAKTVWLSVGNSPNATVLETIQDREAELRRFLESEDRLLVFLRPE